VRDETEWIESCVRFFRNRRIRPMRVWMFGKHANPGSSPEARQAWLDAFRAHNAAVRGHFQSRPQQFLEFDPTQVRDWAPLCRFLDARVPDHPWPHANVSRPDSPWRGAWRRVRQALGLELKTSDAD
jgi:hypothetical protein